MGLLLGSAVVAAAQTTTTSSSTSTSRTTSTSSSTLPGACPATPQAGCQVSPRSTLLLTNGTKKLAVWKWLKGPDVDKLDFGTPLTTTFVSLCVYDYVAGTPTLVLSVTAPAAAACAGGPCWKEKTTGFRYKDKDTTFAGLWAITLHAGVGGKAKITLKGKGATVPLATLPLSVSPQVTVQVKRNDGPACWEAGYTTPVRNLVDSFKAKNF